MEAQHISACMTFGFLLFVIPGINAAYHHEENAPRTWHYIGETGPQHWATLYPSFCSGFYQSPIDIVTATAKPGHFGPLEVHGYETLPSELELINNGHTVELLIKGDYSINGGPLSATYQVEQLHFHWGSINSQGSEHTINGYHYPAEMHIVHWDKDHYNSIGEAVQHRKGLAVMSILIDVGPEADPTLDKLLQHIDQVRYLGGSYKFHEVFLLTGLLPEASELNDYFYYEGSLTTPDCNEVVEWLVFRTPMKVSQEQLDAFRSGYENEFVAGKENTPLADNFRPTQPLHMRKVYKMP